MPVKGGALTRKEAEFITAYVETGFNRAVAEKRAGYSGNGGYVVLMRPEIQERINDLLMAQVGELASAGSKWALSAMNDPKVAAGVKARLYDTALKHRFAAKEAAEKDPSDMNADELSQAIEALEKAKAAMASDVTPAAPEPGDELDVFG